MNNLGEIFAAYAEYLRRSNPSKAYVDAAVKTALVKYTLPGWGLTEGASTQDGLNFMAQIPLHQFKDALQVQENVFKSLSGKASGAIQRTYRMHLKKLLDWCKKQGWWKQEYQNGVPKYSPKTRNNGRGNVNNVRVTNRKRLPNYGLRPDQISKELKDEFEEVLTFATSPEVYKRQDPAIREVTANIHLRLITLILGWLHNVKGVPLEEINLNFLDDIKLAYKFLEWARKERKMNPGSEMKFITAWLLIAKYLHHKNSNKKQYKDIEIIEELRELSNSISKRDKIAPRVADESKKWIDWNIYLAAVEQLKQECAPKGVDGNKRTDTAIASSYQRYLIAAFFAYMPPDRSRTIRELELGRTLVKEGDEWFIKLSPDDYKTGKTYGEQVTKVPEIIYPQLEEWMNKWRKVFLPTHNFLFAQKDGSILTRSVFSSTFRHAMYRLTGKAVNPHLVRSMAITHFFRSGATNEQMDSLAVGMKHSGKAQDSDYDRRTQQEKVKPALDMMLSQKAGALPK